MIPAQPKTARREPEDIQAELTRVKEEMRTIEGAWLCPLITAGDRDVMWRSYLCLKRRGVALALTLAMARQEQLLGWLVAVMGDVKTAAEKREIKRKFREALRDSI